MLDMHFVYSPLNLLKLKFEISFPLRLHFGIPAVLSSQKIVFPMCFQLSSASKFFVVVASFHG
jgi:hypothetical protein